MIELKNVKPEEWYDGIHSSGTKLISKDEVEIPLGPNKKLIYTNPKARIDVRLLTEKEEDIILDMVIKKWFIEGTWKEWDYYGQMAEELLKETGIGFYINPNNIDKFIEKIKNYDTIAKQKKELLPYKKKIVLLKEFMDEKEQKRCGIEFKEYKLEKVLSALNQGYSVISQISWVTSNIDVSMGAIAFTSFKFNVSDEELYDLLKLEVNWRDPKRDIEIYKKRQLGDLLEYISADYPDLKPKAISNVVKKVAGAISYYKGKLFEKKYFQFLKDSGLFEKVILGGASGQPDIFAYKDNELHIFSLKNIKVEKKNQIIYKKEMLPEYKKAYEAYLEGYKIRLALVVFDNNTNIVNVFKTDFKNPEDIIINPDDKFKLKDISIQKKEKKLWDKINKLKSI